MALDWKRATKNKAGNREWNSRCGNYRVAESAVCYGVTLNPVTYSAWERYRARDRDTFVMLWRLVSRHRKRGAAEKACERRAKLTREAA
jgi:hypothetical protein